MRVLQICHKSPFPPMDGGAIAMYQLTKAMLDLGWQVKLLAISTKKHPFIIKNDAIELKSNAEAISVKTKFSPYLIQQFIFYRDGFLSNRFRSSTFKNRLIALLKENQYDLVMLDGAFTGVYFPEIKKYSQATIVLRAHNIEHLLWRERWENASSSSKKALLKSAVKGVEDFEKELFNSVDTIATIAETDRDFISRFSDNKNVFQLPFGLDLSSYTTPCTSAPENPNTVCFIGALDWEPNLQGLLWFTQKCWPVILKELPDAQLIIAGRNAPDDFSNNLPQGVLFFGEVPDAHDFLCQGTVTITPLFSGSGIRIKIIEAMAMGKAVVSTTKGVQGLKVTPGKHLLIGDTYEIFAQHVITLLRNVDLRKKITQNALHFTSTNFDIERTKNNLQQIFALSVRKSE